MLTLLTGGSRRDCEGLRRRDFLRIGSLALGGLSLSGLLRTRATAAEAGIGERAQGQGGRPAVPGRRRQPHRDVRPPDGCARGGPERHRRGRDDDPRRHLRRHVSRSSPRGRRSWRSSVRSAHGVNDHAKAIQHVLTAGNPLGAGMGALYARLRGPNDPRTAMPTHGLVTTEEVDGQYVKEKARVEESSGPGPLGRSYAPFDPAAGRRVARPDAADHAPRAPREPPGALRCPGRCAARARRRPARRGAWAVTSGRRST